MLKYAIGQEAMVGDRIRHRVTDDEGCVTKLNGGSMNNLRVLWDDGKEGDTLDENCLLIARAPSSPAPTPGTDGGRLARSPVDYTGRPYKVGDRFTCTRWGGFEYTVSAIRGGRVYDADSDKPTMIDDSVGLIVSPQESPATTPAPPPSAPPPPVDAEELAGRQRQKHKAESEALTERYESFVTAAKSAVEGTRVELVTDTATSGITGHRFMAELTIDGLKKTIFFSPETAAERTSISFASAMDSFQRQLGRRALGKVGK